MSLEEVLKVEKGLEVLEEYEDAGPGHEKFCHDKRKTPRCPLDSGEFVAAEDTPTKRGKEVP